MESLGNNIGILDVSSLLVLRHSNNSVGVVKNVGQDGNVVDVKPEGKGYDLMMSIDASQESFEELYSDFYHQLKNPSEYSFFKVTEFEAVETAIGLQNYIDSSSSFDRNDLKDYEISIDTVDVLKNTEKLKIENSD